LSGQREGVWQVFLLKWKKKKKPTLKTYIFYPSPSPPLLMSPEAGRLPAMLLFIALSICTIFLIKMGEKKISMASQPSQLKKKGPPAVAGQTCPCSLGGGRGASCPVGTAVPAR
uniref:Uncharacterized protein n=1 Tax=Cairina moschata TaxID=8855 RepID=A0A8C3CH82_CAIMO